MKKAGISLLVSLMVMSGVTAMAEEAAPAEAVKTNMTAAYPVVDGMLPAEPVPPEEGIKDYKNFIKYADQVNAYIKVAQQYIDGATNDANEIINKRNEAVKKAQHVVDVYNATLPEQNKKE